MRRQAVPLLVPIVSCVALSVAGCKIEIGKKGGLPEQAPPLVDLEEPAQLLSEPDDEAERAELPVGGFTGVHVVDSRESLDALLEEPEGVLVERVIENSPGAAAGLEEGDLLLEATAAGGPRATLAWPSDWRKVELDTPPGTSVTVLYDRAGAERTCELEIAARVRRAERVPGVRVREEQRVGVVLRQATEVEARAAGLAPGAGAVVVGLSRASPWRRAGVLYEDLLVAVDDEPVAHPTVVLEAIRTAPEDGELELELVRAGERETLDVPVSDRTGELKRITIPLIYGYKRDGESRKWSAILWLFQYGKTPAAWNLRLLWFFNFEGGDADRLREVDA